jgi:hypothetical protein
MGEPEAQPSRLPIVQFRATSLSFHGLIMYQQIMLDKGPERVLNVSTLNQEPDMTKTLPALKAYQGSHRRHDVLVISKPKDGLNGGEVGLFFDQEIGLEILRRVNAYQKAVKALREIAKHTDFCAIGSEARKANELARAALKDTEGE